MEILFPRIVLNSSLLNFDMSAPSNKICSDSIFAIFSGNNFNIDNAETDLPQPDSPTTARNSPLSTLKEILSTAPTVAFFKLKVTLSLDTSSKVLLLLSFIDFSKKKIAGNYPCYQSLILLVI